MAQKSNDTDVLERVETKQRHKTPSQYDIIMWNDDVTPMDAVVIILMEAFQKDLMMALEIMMAIHNSDKGLVGTYPREEAYSRLEVAERLKEEMDIPLMITIEKH